MTMQASTRSCVSAIPQPAPSDLRPFLGRGSPWWARTGMAVVTAAMVCVCSFGSAEGICIDYGDYLHWVGRVDTPHYANAVAVLGTHAYVADYDYGLQVIDITDPAAPLVVGYADTPGKACDVA